MRLLTCVNKHGSDARCSLEAVTTDTCLHGDESVQSWYNKFNNADAKDIPASVNIALLTPASAADKASARTELEQTRAWKNLSEHRKDALAEDLARRNNAISANTVPTSPATATTATAVKSSNETEERTKKSRGTVRTLLWEPIKAVVTATASSVSAITSSTGSKPN
jgi:hypothetical protein